MSQQPLDLRRSIQILRRRKLLVGAAVLCGLLAGAAFTVLNPPMLTSQALVVLSPSIKDTRTQVMVAASDPVLASALRKVDPRSSPQALRARIHVQSLAYNVISISAQSDTTSQAESTANAVASSYVGYLGSGMLPGRDEQARVLQPARDASAATSLTVQLLVTAALGALAGTLIAVIAVLIISRSDRRLRARDEIAESIGVPVLASVPVEHPSDTADWKKLLEDYEPGAIDAWRLRKSLQLLGLELGMQHDNGNSSLMVLSFSHDRKALALAPQLAVFAASLGVPTALVLGPQQDADATAALRAACSGFGELPAGAHNLRVTVQDHDDASRLPSARLAVFVAVVDGRTPRLADTGRTTATVLGVSAGTVTAEQLARGAAAAATAGHHVAGILVADPDPTDHTTGRLPPLGRLAQRPAPARITGTVTEPRR